MQTDAAMSHTTTTTVRNRSALNEFVTSNVVENGSYQNINEYLRDLIRRWPALPLEQRMNFLRRRMSGGGTCL